MATYASTCILPELGYILECFNLATNVGTQTIRNVHGKYGKRRQVQCTGSDHHCHVEAPVNCTHTTVVVGRVTTAEL